VLNIIDASGKILRLQGMKGMRCGSGLMSEAIRLYLSTARFPMTHQCRSAS
jgi:hypothetical protein